MFRAKPTVPCFELAGPKLEEIFELGKPDYCSASSWVIEKVQFLKQRLGFPNKGENFLFEPTTDVYELLKSGRSVDVQAVVDRICKHIHFGSIPKFVYDWDLDLDIAGATAGQAMYTDGPVIKVRLDFTCRFRELGAILAHEIMHHYLTTVGVQLIDKNENEKLVDLCTVYLGLGKILMNGCDVRYDQEKEQLSANPTQVGYLKLDALAYALDLICCLAVVDPHTWTLNLSPEARYYVQSRAENRIQMYLNYRRAQSKYDKALERYKKELHQAFCYFSKMVNDLDAQWKDFNQRLESIKQIAQKLTIEPKNGKVFVQMNNNRFNLEQKINKVKQVFVELGDFYSELENPQPSRDTLTVIEEKLRGIYPYLEELAGVLRSYYSVLKKY